MKTLHAIIPTKDFLNENAYSDFLFDFEEKKGKIMESVIAHKCANDKENMVLEITVQIN